MAGTFSTDLTPIKAAEATADYSLVGTLKSAMALNDDYKLESTNCITCGVSSATGTGTASILALTPSANLNLTGAGYHFFMWIKGIAWPSMAIRASGGLGMSISSDAPPTAVISVLSAVVVNGGTSGTYAVSDVLTVVGGTGTAATLTVTGVSAGKVTTVIPTASTRGAYTTFPTNPVSVTGGGGTGATFTLTSINTTTNTKQWFVGGSNTDSVVGWTNYVVDIDGTPDISIGTPAMNSVDRMGFRMTATAVVKVANFIFDVSRYGKGSTINDGTGSVPVTLADYQVYDNANARSWGVVTTQNGIYFICGKLNIGTVAQSAETVFKEQANVIVYQDFPVASTFYEILVVGASAQKTTFQLGSYDPASGLTSGGCTIKGSGNVNSSSRTDGTVGIAHSVWTLTASDANQVTKLYASTFSEMLSAALAYNAVSIELTTNCTTNGTVTLVTSDSYDTSGIVIGMKVTGTNIDANTYVSSIESATSLTMDKAATGSGSSLTMTFTHNNEIRGCTFSNFGTITTNGCVIDSCTFQDVKTGAPISATYALIVNSTTEMGRITNSKFINCNRAIKITTAGDYTFTGNTFSGNTYDIENSAAGANVTDIYSESNSDGTIALNDSTIGVSQSFTGDGNKLANAVFYLSKTNAPSGNAVAKVYAHSGTFASSSLPTGTALATSRNVDVTALTGSLALTTFYFGDQGQNITLTNGTKYVVTIEYSSGTSSNTVNVGRDASSATAAGSCATLVGTTWTSTATTTDACFYVRTGGVVTITLASGSNPSANKVLNSNAIPGAITINTGVNITVHVQDSSQVNITGAGVQIFQTSTPTNIIANTTTDGSGNIVGSTTLSVGTGLTIRVRKSSSGTRYVPAETTTTVPSVDSTITVVLTVDTIAA